MAIVMLVGACGGGGDKAESPGTTQTDCLRVSHVFTANMEMHPPSALGAVVAADNGGLWYVASADGALWSTTGDPTAGAPDPDGFVAPLNREALEVSILGSAQGVGGPHAQGATAEDPEAQQAIACARDAESSQ